MSQSEAISRAIEAPFEDTGMVEERLPSGNYDQEARLIDSSLEQIKTEGQFFDYDENWDVEGKENIPLNFF